MLCDFSRVSTFRAKHLGNVHVFQTVLYFKSAELWVFSTSKTSKHLLFYIPSYDMTAFPRHSMWALFEGSGIFNYFVSVLVSSTVNCLDKKTHTQYFCILHDQHQYLQNKNLKLWCRSRESRQVLLNDGKHLFLLSGGKLPSQGSSTKAPAPCFTASSAKHSHQRTRVQICRNWHVLFIPVCCSFTKRSIPRPLVTLRHVHCNLLFLLCTAILFQHQPEALLEQKIFVIWPTDGKQIMPSFLI